MIKALLAVVSLASLAVCIASPFLYFWAAMSAPAYKETLATASVAWFVFATLWATRRPVTNSNIWTRVDAQTGSRNETRWEYRFITRGWHAETAG